MDFWYSHALISEDTRDGIFGQCNFSRIGPLQVAARVESASSNVRPCHAHNPDLSPQSAKRFSVGLSVGGMYNSLSALLG